MFSSLRSFGHYFGSYPLRGVLTIVTVAIGVAALAITFSLSFDVANALEESLSADGYRIVIANAVVLEDGSLERQLPPVFTADTPDLLETEYENLRDTTIISQGRWNTIATDEASYQLRSSIAVEPEYESLMGLEMLAGSFIAADDVESRRPVLVVSERTAQILFGDPVSSVGQTVYGAVPGVQVGQNGQARFAISMEPFTVIGVFADTSELEREAYGIGDILIPLGINLPAGVPVTRDPQAYVAARLVNDSIETAESRIRATLELAFGDDTAIGVWEGTGAGPEPLIAESRKAVSSFALTINVLGLVILVASSIGIFSIMLVEVLGRIREIGLRRALGATKWGIRRFFVGQALYYSFFGSVVGVGLAFAFYRAIGTSLIPFFESSGLSLSDISLTTPGPLPIALAVGAAVIIGALFGFFPAISASRTSIVGAIREDAA
jgi:putative ABC transport system permease protein